MVNPKNSLLFLTEIFFCYVQLDNFPKTLSYSTPRSVIFISKKGLGTRIFDYFGNSVCDCDLPEARLLLTEDLLFLGCRNGREHEINILKLDILEKLEKHTSMDRIWFWTIFYEFDCINISEVL